MVDGGLPIERLASILTRESPAALVRAEGRIVGIVSRYDLLQQMIGTR
jgi:predicted transcriptional regulator